MGMSPQCRCERDARARGEEVSSVLVASSLLLRRRYSYCDLSFESSAEPVQTADQDLVVIACDQSTELAEEDKEDWEMD